MLSGETALPDHPYNGIDTISVSEALNPDPGTEADFVVRGINPFAFTAGQLNKFLNPKSLAAYKAVGGVRGLERGLRTDLVAGLSVDEMTLEGAVSFDEATRHKKKGSLGSESKYSAADDYPAAKTGGATGNSAPVEHQFQDRKRIFKDNALPAKSAKSIWKLMWEQYQDKILILLTVAAVISLALGLYEALGVKHPAGSPPSVDWVEGVAIVVAIVIVVLVGSLNDWQKERQFVKLNAKKEDRVVKAIRSGKSVQISVHDIMVGDVLHLEPGDMIPADGIFITGHNLKCDESSATGESDQMKKTPGEEVMRQIEAGTASSKLDPFILSGSKVLEGVGTYLVTSVGVNSSFGKIMMALRHEAEATPLQVKLTGLADNIAYLGGGAACLLFFVLFIKFLAHLPDSNATAAEKGSEFLDILIVAITLIVVAVPEGLPLAVTLALAFATTRMLKENNLVRVLRACETMGNATTICSDKTGTLTQNKMTVVAGTIGLDSGFSAQAEGSEDEKVSSIPKVVSTFSKWTKDLLLQSVVVNSTAFEGEEDGIFAFIGSKTETALLTFARDFLGMQGVAQERANAHIVQFIPFDSARKCMGVVVRLPDGVYRLYVKGASEILLSKATRYIADVSSEGPSDRELTQESFKFLTHAINSYAERSLRTIGMLYKDYSQWPPIGAKVMEDDPSMANFDDIFNEMILVGIVGIQDPLRPGVSEAVRQCQGAGVIVRMVTGDNVVTAQAIAAECGIFTEGGIVMEGLNFRKLTEPEMDKILPRLQVLARSSPEDKRILVRRLKELGETVAVTGDGTNDGPALKMADIGFSMGIAGTEVAKEASSIILMDDNFSSIVKAMMWGRAVNDAVRKFLQFQLTVNITAVLLTFVSAVSSADGSSVLTAVQLLWVNLIMDTFAALALATDAPTPQILNRKPTPKSASIISLNMWKMIIGQAIFQLLVTYTLYFGGMTILGYSTENDAALKAAGKATPRDELNTMVFNTFVWMQIFNEFNNRRLDNKFNIFENVHKNYFFLVINAIMIGGQVLIISVGGKAFSIVPIDGVQWAICVIVAAFALPWAIIVRCVPDEFVRKHWYNAVHIFSPPVKALAKVIPKRNKKAEAQSDEEKGTAGEGKP
ncbi:calcium-translocating P-type ATPase [Choiromyces venosus 120613-1]|uniref:Calcium-transporting ATPase n=1 Tax=Choiromyces venosus 120613-1 TaxID=1336337 RepID=A0A3N4J9D6_9PEZI|nr:calcium-translocating P-type ATPase [Choiromyces venosus 120613-1]